jgi:dihydroorotase
VVLLDAVVSGDQRFFLGTDSAPHARSAKEQACGCAGIYSAHAALELYAQIFEDAGALHRLEGFASEYGPRFYGLPLNEGFITLSRDLWTVPASYPFGQDVVVPMMAGEQLRWRVAT